MSDINAHIPVSDNLKQTLTPYLPPKGENHVTLTYAQSLDSRIAAKRDERTTISSEETKRMTHWLRAHHDGILVGVQTAIIDNPGLHCKSFLDENHKLQQESPQPIILDPQFRWEFKATKLACNAAHNGYKAPIVVTKSGYEIDTAKKFKKKGIEDFGGKVLMLDDFSWESIFNALHNECGLKSIMVEGGAHVIESMLEVGAFDSLVVTVGPVFLGRAGLEVSPKKSVILDKVKWAAAERDSVMCAVQQKQ
ncbi:2,5-diamino-6-ribosylamino-4(3H)-pyrimidinone 5'-phosphate reductase [Yarrowia sp. B02]|nr:2,5-diamino-6-ribosylamino-4(3H)-pyrimidinone 5'-phosphate reductase [Yarrowia sp. B02]